MVTEAVQTAVTVARVLSLTFLIVISLIAFVEIVNLAFFSDGRLAWSRKVTDRPRLWLLMTSIFGLWTMLTVFLSWWVDWTDNLGGCKVLMDPQSPLVYILTKQFLYLFLFDRAKIVHNALGLNGIKMRMLRWLIFISITVGVPALVWWMFFVYWEARVIAGVGVCVQYTESIGAIVAVASLDFTLSLATLFLFVVPLTKHAKVTHASHSSQQFRRLLRRNLTVSVVLISSTLIALIFMAVELSIVFGDSPDPNLEHMQIWATIFPTIDVFVTVVASHTLTTAWIPSPIRKRIISSKTKDESPTVLDISKLSPRSNDSRSLVPSVRMTSKVENQDAGVTGTA